MMHQSLRDFPIKPFSVHTPSATLRSYVNVWMYILFSDIGCVQPGLAFAQARQKALNFARFLTDLELTHN